MFSTISHVNLFWFMYPTPYNGFKSLAFVMFPEFDHTTWIIFILNVINVILCWFKTISLKSLCFSFYSDWDTWGIWPVIERTSCLIKPLNIRGVRYEFHSWFTFDYCLIANSLQMVLVLLLTGKGWFWCVRFSDIVENCD